MKFFSLMLLAALSLNSYAKKYDIERVEPLNWWVGMQNKELQIMVYGEDIATLKPVINYPGVTIKRVVATENPNYQFIYVDIAKDTKPGDVKINFVDTKGKTKSSYNYPLEAREENSADRAGFTSSDVVYLLMPDRFANGNPNNDSTEDTAEKANRQNPDGRHGGDIEGVIQKLDYLEDLGATAIWSTPMMEDNMAEGSYHTYAITDYYRIDPRYGTNDDYRRLSKEASKRGIKLIMDVVTNHCGLEHWWMKDLPSKDWVNNNDKFVQCNFKISAMADPNASKADLFLNNDGWFAQSMPDLNQGNPLLRDYLAQNTIWWVEFADLGGLRIDTYPYNFKEDMNAIVDAVMAEYPNTNIVGECWVPTPTDVAYWQKDSELKGVFNSSLPTIMDFPLADAKRWGMNENEGWGTGLDRIYKVLSHDFLYGDVNNIMTFIDNHDMDRYSESVKHDVNKYNMAYTMLFTMRGIPQIFYGGEIMMPGAGPHGILRKDFPGGWEGDDRDAFTAQGRTETENVVFNHIHKLMNWRKGKEVIHTGKTTHFTPQDGLYVYFRYNQNEKVMVIINKNDKEVTFNSERYKEHITADNKGYDIISEKEIPSLGSFTIPAMSSMVIEVK